MRKLPKKIREKGFYVGEIVPLNIDSIIQKIRLDKLCAIPLDDRPDIDSDQDVTSLAASMKELGQLQPIKVQELDPGSKDDEGEEVDYAIVAGKRRVEAAKLLGWEEISAIVVDGTDDVLTLSALADNLAQKEVTPIVVGKLLKELLDSGVVKNQTQLAEMMGRSQPTISKWLALADIPDEVQAAVVSGEVTQSEAVAAAGKAKKQKKESGEEVQADDVEKELVKWSNLDKQHFVPKESDNGSEPVKQFRVAVSKEDVRFSLTVPYALVKKGGLTKAVSSRIEEVGDAELTKAIKAAQTKLSSK